MAKKEFDTKNASKVFGVLSDETRLAIIMALKEGEKNVTTLCQELGKPQPTISHHLGLLRANTLVEDKRDGKQVVYKIADNFPTLVYDGVKIK